MSFLDLSDKFMLRRLRKFHDVLAFAHDAPEFTLSHIIKALDTQVFPPSVTNSYALGLLVGILISRRFPKMKTSIMVASLKAKSGDSSKPNPFETDFDLFLLGKPKGGIEK